MQDLCKSLRVASHPAYLGERPLNGYREFPEGSQKLPKPDQAQP